MAKLLLALLISFAPALAQAQWFQVNANVTYSNYQATGAVYNQWSSAIYCQGQVTGVTYYGSYLYAWMDTVIYPGQWAYVYVYTDASNPFVNAGGNINCSWY